MVDPSEVRDFLLSRRARLRPRDVGLPPGGGQRRVPGLRREEVALLAGLSVEYYTKLERGHLEGASERVLQAVAEVLRLDAAERDHLFDLARAARHDTTPRPVPPADAPLRESTRVLLGAIDAPAFVRNHRRDIVAANPLGRALYAPMYEDPVSPPNTARFAFLDPRARDFYTDWELAAGNIVAVLRSDAGRYGEDPLLQELVADLSRRSGAFRDRWADHEVRHHHAGRKHYRHPLVGEIELLYEAMPLQPENGLPLSVYPAEPGSPAVAALDRLATVTV